MKTIVYVANADSHDISVLELDAASGALAEIQRFAAAGVVMPLAVGPDRNVLHASIRSAPECVQSLAIDPASGRLREIGRAPLPASMCWISTDASGRWLLAASYGGSLVSVSPIGSDGAAREAQQTIATEAHAHSIRTDPGNRFAFAACLGGGVLRQWRFDATTGRLADNEPAAWRARRGAGPRHFVFHPGAPFAYLLNELDAGIDVLAFDAERGTFASVQTLSTLPAGFDAGAPWAADIHLSPDGRFLYTCERRASTLAVFSVDAASGRLASLGTVPTEAQPRSFAIAPDGRFLFVAGQASHGLGRYAVDAQSGTLDPLGAQAVGSNPNWVEIVELPG